MDTSIYQGQRPTIEANYYIWCLLNQKDRCKQRREENQTLIDFEWVFKKHSNWRFVFEDAYV